MPVACKNRGVFGMEINDADVDEVVGERGGERRFSADEADDVNMVFMGFCRTCFDALDASGFMIGKSLSFAPRSMVSIGTCSSSADATIVIKLFKFPYPSGAKTYSGLYFQDVALTKYL